MYRVELDSAGANRRGVHGAFFDKERAFVLDIEKFSPIIYIWYEG
jgi:hypothetical protein